MPPILRDKHYGARSLFEPEALLREARRQKGLSESPVPALCLLDPDGDIISHLRRIGAARQSRSWACYHTELDEFELAGQRVGIVGRAVGASFAVLVAEQLFASGCRLLVSLTSAGRIVDAGRPPYFIVIDRALRDEGTSYHYLPPTDYSEANPVLVERAMSAFEREGRRVLRGASWTTDAPYRETAEAISAARARGILAVEMEAAALYAFSKARARPVLCIAHITNMMAQAEVDFEKGEDGGAAEALNLLSVLISEFAND
jgi:uridine phosphorylase